MKKLNSVSIIGISVVTVGIFFFLFKKLSIFENLGDVRDYWKILITIGVSIFVVGLYRNKEKLK